MARASDLDKDKDTASSLSKCRLKRHSFKSEEAVLLLGVEFVVGEAGSLQLLQLFSDVGRFFEDAVPSSRKDWLGKSRNVWLIVSHCWSRRHAVAEVLLLFALC